jgi:hypothetical protein
MMNLVVRLDEITVWPKMLKCYSRVGGGRRREKVLEDVTGGQIGERIIVAVSCA